MTATPPIRMVSVPVDEYGRLIEVCNGLIGELSDPGTEALAAVYCAERILHNALTSAPACEEGGAVDDWRPIDSAPQDGTKIDLWGHWPERDRWTRTADAAWDEERGDWTVNGFYAGQYAYPPRFTHWRAISGPAVLATRETAPAEAGEDMVRVPRRLAESARRLLSGNGLHVQADKLAAALRAQPQAREEARLVASEADLKQIVKDLITHRRAGDYDLMADDVANWLWAALRNRAITPPALEAEKLRVAVEALEKASRAISAQYALAQAEYQHLDTVASKHDKIVQEGRRAIREALSALQQEGR